MSYKDRVKDLYLEEAVLIAAKDRIGKLCGVSRLPLFSIKVDESSIGSTN
jgi:hypothetical protein